MKKLALIGVLSLLLVGALPIPSMADRSDFALFDGTNPLNGPGAGVLCGSGTPQRPSRSNYSLYVAVTNFFPGPNEIKLIYPDGDFVRYKIPQDESFSLAQAAGSNEFDRAIRVVGTCPGGCPANTNGLAGAVSAKGHRPFCESCDGVLGDAACDAIIPD